MTVPTLYIGNKNYSSWSMRPWLVLRKAQLPFEETLIPLYQDGTKEKLLALSPAGTVPVLQVQGEMIPDSLAISEWAAKCVPNLWPKDPADRERARALCKQMQDDFGVLRNTAHMNLRRRTTTPMPQDCLDEAARLAAIFEDLLGAHDGPFLFDDWSIADAFATPFATRFHSYGMACDLKVDTYFSELLADEDYLDWEMAALAEPWTIDMVDAV
ncbi:MAG: glutathione S-transferase [Robiginitomaculum sp.]|nr:glutathione S-transferase [Robiginitomaculum sp.]MDQ7078034.1 glutathione S-transferase [Robiginitomaculum sp.]